jgi:hypothetical protein
MLSRWTAIVLRMIGFLDFVHHLEFQILGNTMFQKLILFPSSGEGRDPTEYVSPSPQLKMETDPVSETLCFLELRILDNGQSPETQ